QPYIPVNPPPVPSILIDKAVELNLSIKPTLQPLQFAGTPAIQSPPASNRFQPLVLQSLLSHCNKLLLKIKKPLSLYMRKKALFDYLFNQIFYLIREN